MYYQKLFVSLPIREGCHACFGEGNLRRASLPHNAARHDKEFGSMYMATPVTNPAALTLFSFTSSSSLALALVVVLQSVAILVSGSSWCHGIQIQHNYYYSSHGIVTNMNRRLIFSSRGMMATSKRRSRLLPSRCLSLIHSFDTPLFSDSHRWISSSSSSLSLLAGAMTATTNGWKRPTQSSSSSTTYRLHHSSSPNLRQYCHQDDSKLSFSSNAIAFTVPRGGSASINTGTNTTTARTYVTKSSHPSTQSINSNNTNSNLQNKNNNENNKLHYHTKTPQKTYIAIGSNQGNKYQNFQSALTLLQTAHPQHISVTQTSFLHLTPPMYYEDQPPFLNGVIEIETDYSPHLLLQKLKEMEKMLGRALREDGSGEGVRFGPRVIDLDILLYGVGNVDNDDVRGEKDERVKGSWVVQTPELTIPHERMHEREFVLSPLCDLDPSILHPLMNTTAAQMRDALWLGSNDNDSDNDSDSTTTTPPTITTPTAEPTAVRVLPLPRDRMLYFNETIVMGILNVTPDSFSDGGQYYRESNESESAVEKAVTRALQMVSEGAGIIDIGGESTRPGAKEVLVEVELERTIPVIRRIREVSDIPISIDTRHSTVAKAAIKAGADIVNDISGGTFDPQMLPTVSQLHVPILLMHMRGTPETMQRTEHTTYDSVVNDVAASLLERVVAAERAGIPRWLQVVDPGIGFAKELSGNLMLLKYCGNRMRDLVENVPILIGPSRKGFIGKITGEENPEERDFGTVAACILGALNFGDGVGSIGNEDDGRQQRWQQHLQMSPTILRVHNVKGVKQAVRIMDAIVQAK